MSSCPHPECPGTTATSYRYDPDGNLTRQRLDGAASTVGGSISGGRRSVFTYDTSGRLDRQVDYGTNTGCSDDRRIDSAFTPTGLPSSLTIRASTASLCLSGDEATDTPTPECGTTSNKPPPRPTTTTSS